MARSKRRRSTSRDAYAIPNARVETYDYPTDAYAARVDDTRFYHPEEGNRPPLLLSGVPSRWEEVYRPLPGPRLLWPSASRQVSRRSPAISGSWITSRKSGFNRKWYSAFAFAHPPRVVTCIRRWTRKEVLFARGVAGRKGRKHKPRRTWRSTLRC